MTSKKDTLGLMLPNYFKKVGIAVIALTVLAVVVIKLSGLQLSVRQLELAPTMMLNFIIVGLLFITLSRDKEEDEMTLVLRWKAMAWAFLTGSMYIIVLPIVNFIMQNPYTPITGQYIVMFMLIGFLLVYARLKRTR